MLKRGVQKTAMINSLKVTIVGLPPLISFSFNYGEKSQAIMTLFTQEMLRWGILASGSIDVTYSLKEKHVKKYLAGMNKVFGILQKAITEDKVNSLLQGPVAYAGFRRLT